MNSCVTGLQWGDEGKGKIVDVLAEKSDIVVRYAGGANAGHTVVIGNNKFSLHLLPSGVVREGVVSVIANGVVLDAGEVIEEIEKLREQGIDLTGRLIISENAHVVMDYHKLEDQLRENALGKNKIGTTIRGIGPCYADKIGRSYAIRVCDLLDTETLKGKLQKIIKYKNMMFAGLYGADPIDIEDVFNNCVKNAEKLKAYVTDTTEYLHKAIEKGESVLFEGAQGALLDIDHGTFPFVTSSNASSLGMPSGCGVPAKKVDKFVGVVKAYTTRVGAGPFPSELENETGQKIREKGNEYGTTTGRARRCGWFDAVAVDYSVKIGSIDEIALLHLDTLTGFEELKICTGYEIDGVKTDFFPANSGKLSRAECIYQSLKGWSEDITKAESFDELPRQAKEYIRAIEQAVGKPVKIIGVGPKREQTIYV